MAFDFIKTLNESTLVRGEKDLKKFSSRDVADLIFLYFVSLYILSREFSSAPFAIKYAGKTLGAGDIDVMRSSGTDLHVLMHVLFGKMNMSSFNNLKDPEANKVFINTLNFDWSRAKKFLNDISNKSDVNKRFLLELEEMLQIKTSDYKSLRRVAIEWDDLQEQDRQAAMTRLLMALRSRANKSDLLAALEKLSKERKLEIAGARNPEKDAPKKSISGTKIGAAVGGLMIANALKNYIKDADKGLFSSQKNK